VAFFSRLNFPQIPIQPRYTQPNKTAHPSGGFPVLVGNTKYVPPVLPFLQPFLVDGMMFWIRITGTLSAVLIQVILVHLKVVFIVSADVIFIP